MATASPETSSGAEGSARPVLAEHHLTNRIVQIFLESNLSLILILLASVLGLAALLLTPREEDPQIVVPVADVHVSFPGHSAEEVEKWVSTPLERLLYQIDGVEYVYSMSRRDSAVITVRFYVGEDRERSLVKIYKRIDEHLDIVPAGVTGWTVKPVEIDDVPIVTLTLRSGQTSPYLLRRVAEEVAERLAAVPDTSRVQVFGGQSRQIRVELDPDRMAAHHVSVEDVRRAVAGANLQRSGGQFARDDRQFEVQIGRAVADIADLGEIIVGVSDDRPVPLKAVAELIDGPAEIDNYVRHGWGRARFAQQQHHEYAPGTILGEKIAEGGPAGQRPVGEGQPSAAEDAPAGGEAADDSVPAVTVAVAKKKGTNAVRVSRAVIRACETLKREIVPNDITVVVTRNVGLTSNEKVNELIEALAVAVLFVIAVLTLGLGLRESMIVAVAVPVVFGLTLTVNYLAGVTINRVTLFALILSLGLLVDDPIVDVENIVRHFRQTGRATRRIVLEAVAEIRPPLITATLAVIVSFLPMSFITGMMGPYMRPMAMNVPVAMIMSMLVAFTITPWLAYVVLHRRYHHPQGVEVGPHDPHEVDVRNTWLYRLFYPLMAPLLRSRRVAWAFLVGMALATALAGLLPAARLVPLKMLPFDNKNEFLLVLNFDEGTTLERSDAAVRRIEEYLRRVPEVTDFTSYVGLASPMDFNGMVRHYYLRQGPHVAEVRVNLVGKKSRRTQSHGLTLRVRDDLSRIAAEGGARLAIVEIPPGPPVLASVVAEVYGRPDHTYADLQAAARTVEARLMAEPGVVDVDTTIEAEMPRWTFVVDKEKAALNGTTTRVIAEAIRTALAGEEVGYLEAPHERQPPVIRLRLPRALRSGAFDLTRLHVPGVHGRMVPLAELGRWEAQTTEQTLYHKNLERVVYVFADTAGRPPADVVVDVQADRRTRADTDMVSDTATRAAGSGRISTRAPRPLEERTYLRNGSDVPWLVPDGIRVDFAGEGEWKITLDVFRDLGLAFGAALVGIYILLVAQTGSFVIPVVVMLAIPLTILGIMPGFWLLNVFGADRIAGYADPVYFTATGMIGMIALAGIVTRDSIILVDFIHLSLARGRSLFDAIMESRVVRLRPILLTAATAMLSALPIVIDPIFSGLAWSLIFGLLASTVFTLFVIPVTYWLLYAHKPGHGLPVSVTE